MKDVNLIIILLRCGGADGVDIYLGKKYLAAAEHIYEITDILNPLFDKIDMSKEICIREIDIDNYVEEEALDYFYEITKDDPDEIHNQFTDEEIEAIYKEDYNLFSKLFNERCGGHIDE